MSMLFESAGEIRSIFDDIGVKAKVTFSDDCSSDILQLINRSSSLLWLWPRRCALFSRAAADRAWGAPIFQTSLLPSGS